MTKTNLIIHGGIGNQLFQFFFALKKLNGEGKLLRIIIANNKHPNQFDITNILEKNKINKIKIIRINSIFIKLISKINCLPKKILNYLLIVSDKNSFESLEQINNPLIIYGYFQDLNLLNKNHISDFIIPELKNTKTQTKDLETLGIHIRRGDYLKKQHFSMHGIITIEYIFQNFVEIFKNFSLIKIYSDSDIKDEFIENYRKYLGDEYYLKTTLLFSFDKNKSDKEVFLDMTRNDILVCTNSTFSYWAGFLSSRVKKIYLPIQWYYHQKINEGLIHPKVTLY